MRKMKKLSAENKKNDEIAREASNLSKTLLLWSSRATIKIIAALKKLKKEIICCHIYLILI